jgi:hypothetical protein
MSATGRLPSADMQAGDPAVSVCILTSKRPALLDLCLASRAAHQDPPAFEVLVGADPDPEVIGRVDAHGLTGAVLQVAADDGRLLPSSDKRNILMERARGRLLLFLDDDVQVDPELLADLVEDAEDHPDASVFGGPNLTPHGSSRFQVVQGAVLGSLIGSGPSRRRWGAHPAGFAREPHFTLCNLAVRSSAMVPFPTGLRTGEECAVLNRLRQDGHPMWYDPRLAVYHERRATPMSFLRQVRGYGRGRAVIVREDLQNFRPWFLLPMALLGYLVALPGLVLVTPWAMVPVAAYLSLIAAQAVRIAVSLRRWWWAGPAAAALLAGQHVAYGIGALGGLVASPRPVTAGPARWAELARS